MPRRIFFAALLLAGACSKDAGLPAPAASAPVAPVSTTTSTTSQTTSPADPWAGYRLFRIRAGQNYCDSNAYPAATVTAVRFRVVFDSSCIYTNADPRNQADINKLWGFADSGTFHQINSARFGWNWQDGKMHLHAYCYVHGERQYRELGTVPLNKAQDCAVQVLPGRYIFTLNGKSDTVRRGSEETVARGYLLYPYFGGDETAPHEVRIRVQAL